MNQRYARLLRHCGACAMLVLFGPTTQAWAQIAIDWMEVGDPGNPDHPTFLQGSIPYLFDIAKTEVTNAQ